MVTGNGILKETRQERASVTTTDVTAVVNNAARIKNQITGYKLTGFGATTTTSVVDGPTPRSCADASSGFVLDPDSVVNGVPGRELTPVDWSSTIGRDLDTSRP